MELLSDYDYELPEQLIAQVPLSNRSDSKLLVLKRGCGAVQHRHFVDVLDYVNAGDALVINTSKVMKARLLGNKVGSGGRVEILLTRKLSSLSPFSKGGIITSRWLALVSAKGKKQNLKVELGKGVATIIGPAPEDPGAFIVDIEGDVEAIIAQCGEIPLPPYIARKPSSEDTARYQTVYANNNSEASVASPTAGLHFDEALLEKIRTKGVKIIPVTLHVGPGTFIPVRHDDISQHKMHGEWAEISEDAAQEINKIKQKGGRIIAVGTTAVRTLESAADENGTITPGAQLTRLFIRPGFRFKIVDALITNFHLPKTTLLMLVAAAAGRERILDAYREAIANDYRFFSYGDASYIEIKDLS